MERESFLLFKNVGQNLHHPLGYGLQTLDNDKDNILIYNRTKDSPNNQPCSHTNGYAWDNAQCKLSRLHDDGDVLGPYVDDDVLVSSWTSSASM